MNIYVKAYLDKNLGDDLMLYHLLNYFSNNNSEHIFYIHCEKHLVEYYNNLLREFLNYKLIQCILRRINRYNIKFNLILQIGGSVLQGKKYSGCWYRFLNCRLFDKLKRVGINYIIIGCNTGPFKNSFMEYFVKKEISKTSLITTRDINSFNYIKDIVSKDTVHYFPDILFGISNIINIKEKNESNILGIAVHGKSKEIISGFLAEFCEIYNNKTNSKIRLFCFDAGIEDDLTAANMIYERVLNKENIEIICHEASYNNFLSSMSECNRIVAIRFHAAIIASAIKIPYITISYNNKMRNFMNDINHINKDFPVESINSTSIQEFIDILINDPVIPNDNMGINNSGHFKTLMNWLS